MLHGRLPMNSAARRLKTAAWLGSAAALWTTLAQATVVERVVAVVGEQAIWLSEVRDRAKPFLLRLEQQAPDGAHRAAATSQLYAQLVEHLVEEELEQKAANRANMSVTAREVEDALGRVATQNGVTIAQVLEEAQRSGLTEPAYRSELRRQLLEAKLLNLRIQGRLRVTEEDTRVAYQTLVHDERKQLGFQAAWIRISAPRALSPQRLKERRTEIERIVADAKSGVPFEELARRHSEDPATRSRGGMLGSLRPGQLPAAVDAVSFGLDVGEVSDPIRVGDDFVILKVIARDKSQLPSYAEARQELSQRVYMEKMGKARRHWLEGLRRQTHVEVRL